VSTRTERSREGRRPARAVAPVAPIARGAPPCCVQDALPPPLPYFPLRPPAGPSSAVHHPSNALQPARRRRSRRAYRHPRPQPSPELPPPVQRHSPHACFLIQTKPRGEVSTRTERSREGRRPARAVAPVAPIARGAPPCCVQDALPPPLPYFPLRPPAGPSSAVHHPSNALQPARRRRSRRAYRHPRPQYSPELPPPQVRHHSYFGSKANTLRAPS